MFFFLGDGDVERGVVLVVVGVPFVSCTGRGIGCVVGKGHEEENTLV